MKELSKKSYKKLWRSRKDRRIAGVCGGLGEYFNMDPTWIRIIFIIFLLLGGSALIIYALMWIIVPLEPTHWC
jgi:phage shock protein C